MACAFSSRPMLARCTRSSAQLSARSVAAPRSRGGAPRLSARAPAAGRAPLRRGLRPAFASAPDAEPPASGADGASKAKPVLDGLGLSLGPVAMTFEASSAPAADKGVASRLASASGVTLGPIALSLGESAVRDRGGADEASDAAAAEAVRLNALSSNEWRQAHLRGGACCCGVHSQP